MLVLSRKTSESITIGDSIKIVIVDARRNRVRLGIEAPIGFSVIRSAPHVVGAEATSQTSGQSMNESGGIPDVAAKLRK